MLLVPQAGARTWGYALYSHQPHEPLYPLSVDWMALVIEPCSYLAAAVKRRMCVLLINQAHQVQVLSALLSRSRLVIPARPVQPDQLTLALNTHFRMTRLYALPPVVNGHCQIFFSTSPAPF